MDPFIRTNGLPSETCMTNCKHQNVTQQTNVLRSGKCDDCDQRMVKVYTNSDDWHWEVVETF